MVTKVSKDKWIGVKSRQLKDYNYKALWNNLTTIRFDVGETMELPPEYSEFYDVSLGNKCTTSCMRTKYEDGKLIEYEGTTACPFCYVSANPDGQYYEDVCETWKKWMTTYPEDKWENGICLTIKPLQIAIGSQGEPCETPYFCDFLETVYKTNVIPNYTTNGVILASWNKPESKWYELANKILAYTSKYVGGVAVSYGNKALRNFANDALEGLFEKGDCHVMIHHIISTKESVDEFVECWKKYGDKIRNHVLLPLMPCGRSQKGMEDGVFEYLEDAVTTNDIKNVAFGAHFIKYLEKSDKIKTWHYPAETYSKNVILTKDKVQITPSSFDLKPIKIIDL